MPRSGTTLLEQVLSVHRDVFGAGELRDLPSVVDDPALIPGGFPDGLRAAQDDLLRRAGARYVAAIRARAPAATRITDKLPANFLHVGAIRLQQPNARILHCVRDPRDTCLSILRQNFEGDLRFAYEPEELARYYALCERPAAHWRTVLPPGAMLEVRYEDFVADLDGTTRRVFEFLGLDWDPACLAFHRSDRTVRTSSMDEVRRPLYSTSVGAWRRHAARAPRLMQALERHLSWGDAR